MDYEDLEKLTLLTKKEIIQKTRNKKLLQLRPAASIDEIQSARFLKSQDDPKQEKNTENSKMQEVYLANSDEDIIFIAKSLKDLENHEEENSKKMEEEEGKKE